MKKSKLVITILVVLALFAAGDYYLNNLSNQVSIEDLKQPAIPTTPSSDTVSASGSIYNVGDDVMGYKVISQVQTNQIFEKIDLSNITNIKIYRNRLEKESSPASAQPEEGTAVTADETEPIYLYEIHAPKGQGSLTYLNVKLQFISQIDTESETINEDASFGNSSFFFNDMNYQNTAFLLTQINDNLFAFQYSKQDSNIYEDVKSIIQSQSSASLPSTAAEQPAVTSSPAIEDGIPAEVPSKEETSIP